MCVVIFREASQHAVNLGGQTIHEAKFQGVSSHAAIFQEVLLVALLTWGGVKLAVGMAVPVASSLLAEVSSGT
jgi:hypothetical protein